MPHIVSICVTHHNTACQQRYYRTFYVTPKHRLFRTFLKVSISFYSLLEVTEKQQQDLEKEAKRSHLALEKTQKTSEKRERAYKAKVEALEKQVIIQLLFKYGKTCFNLTGFQNQNICKNMYLY